MTSPPSPAPGGSPLTPLLWPLIGETSTNQPWKRSAPVAVPYHATHPDADRPPLQGHHQRVVVDPDRRDHAGIVQRSMTRSSSGTAQQTRMSPSAGSSIGGGS